MGAFRIRRPAGKCRISVVNLKSLTRETSMQPIIQHYADVQQLSTAAAELICQKADVCLRERGDFTLVLSGGSTPRTLYATLSQEPYLTRMPWNQTHLFWGDERYVPPDHPDSNVAMASDALLAHIPIPPENVHAIPTRTASPEAAAEQYDATLRSFFAGQPLPVFDLILLGMGTDGHTASLFPESPTLKEQERWVVATPVPNLNPPVRRITLTFPVINAARTIVFLVAGAAKHPLVQTITEHPEQSRQRYPAANVRPHGELYWFVA
ncbi:6-phosphogluconolactonase [candidate division KSB3 bacterium]|uniref:6-phosphogluconolactonase n=1 Tax=candidate division KSB3 bacterium TaxID=2044937 RepID=A0A9D5Q8F0_9BACT|nr:6-phosphogluconolactonase [candidate division KSB3 bacterium]MBD3326821.1 6-phosphogluconolactonase [candidate division KSB3 bacterium]